MFRSLGTLVFLLFIVLLAFVGSQLFIKIAPWRTVEILILAATAPPITALLWFYGRNRRWIRAFLVLSSIVVAIGLAYLGYQFFESHYQRQFPIAHLNLDIAHDTSASQDPSALPTQLIELARATPGRRDLLLQILEERGPTEPLLSIADALVQSKYTFYAYEPAQLKPNLTWKENPYDDPSWNWSLHNMYFVVILTLAYEQTKDTAYLQRAEELIMDWISDNTLYWLDPPTRYSWNDHTTAFRLLNWMYFFDIWKISGLAQPEEMDTILRSMLGHAQMLEDERFYTKNHNHGIDQDRALIAFSLMHPYFTKNEERLKLALTRLKSQIDFAVSDNGVHLEHSPEYHMFGTRQLQTIHNFLGAWDVEHEIVAITKDKVDLMAQYIPNLVQPDGHLPTVGDTRVVPITAYKNDFTHVTGFDPLLQEFLETGNTQRRIDTVAAYPEEGYVFIRDTDGGRLDFASSLYFFFVAGAHEGRGHRTEDDLSFVLSYGGRQILIDPGVYSYRDDAGRKYVESAAGHNTLLLDDTSYKGWDTTINEVATNDHYTFIRASHRNYNNFEHVRLLIYVPPRMFLLIDRFAPTGDPDNGEDHRIDQLFHFAPSLRVRVDDALGQAVVTASEEEDQAVMLVTQLNDQSPKMRIALGEHSPMQGWHSPSHGTLIPTPTLVARIEGESAQYVTLLQIASAGQSLEDLREQRKAVRITFGDESFTMQWGKDGVDATMIFALDSTNTRFTRQHQHNKASGQVSH